MHGYRMECKRNGPECVVAVISAGQSSPAVAIEYIHSVFFFLSWKYLYHSLRVWPITGKKKLRERKNIKEFHAVAVRVWPIIELLHLMQPTVDFQPNSTSCPTTGQIFCFGSTAGR